MQAFDAGDRNWWRYGAEFVLYARNAEERWLPEDSKEPAEVRALVE